MNNESKDEINQIIFKLLSNVNPNEKPPIILSSQDIDMIIDSTYYSLKMNLNPKNLFQDFSPNEISKTELNSIKQNAINYNEINNYIKQAEK